ncbi:helix-turn-helix domain-containing protein [Kangiella taiwanensis]|uniref:HTH cro/C1-type domain-containing protein n=1 Tax=Kangiella taiwanensis TaxID=1079179 RepID=A0ABP8HT87_9GAMM|nr:helix-turn-helix domain-containing protein [Kangiella taiwanensis]
MPKQRVTSEQEELAQRIGQALGHAKKSLSKSKAQVAQECGVTAQAVNNWLRRGKISKRSLILLAEATAVDFMWLYSGISPENTGGNYKPSHLTDTSTSDYSIDKKRLSHSIEKVLTRTKLSQLSASDYELLADYITAEYYKALKDDDIIDSLLELNND